MNSRVQILRRKRTTSRRPMPDLFSNVDDIRPTDRRSNRSNTMFSYFCSQRAEDQKFKRISRLPKRILIKNWRTPEPLQRAGSSAGNAVSAGNGIIFRGTVNVRQSEKTANGRASTRGRD